MNRHGRYQTLTLVGLAIALGVMMLSLHHLILLSDLFGLDSAHREAHQATMLALATAWPWELLVLVACAGSVLLGYRLLIGSPGRDMPTYRAAFIVWLIFGGIMSALQTTTGDWYLGLQAYLLFGAMSAVITVVVLAIFRLIVAAGKRLDAWYSHYTT
jgi:hypothetical protein